MGLLWGFHGGKDLIMVMMIAPASKIVERIICRKITYITRAK